MTPWFWFATFSRTAMELVFDMMMEGKSTFRRRPDLLRYASDVAACLGMTERDAGADAARQEIDHASLNE